MAKFHIYILTNKTNRVLYIGVTNNLRRRIYEHQNKLNPGFTKKYNVNKLIYFEDIPALMKQ
jgi:predicted GIY-YIG superfamily endonuclease